MLYRLTILIVLPVFLFAVDLKIDHVTVAGSDLKKMQSDLSAIGIPSSYGGPHSNRATEMALISFPDGSYLELIAIQANADPQMAAALRQLGANTNLIKQVQGQFLSGAGPEATEKFNELLGGLMSGKLTVNDIRAEAQTAADQIRALKRETGEDPGWVMDGYLGILDHFLKETAPPTGSATNAPGPAPRTKPKPERLEQ